MSQGISFTPRTGLHRGKAGVLALTYPLILIVLTIGVGFRQGGGAGEFGASFAASVMFLIAAPTAWVLAIDFIEAERFTILLFGAATSLPLWAIMGSFVASITTAWRQWIVRYFAICAVWTTLYVVVIGLIAAVMS